MTGAALLLGCNAQVFIVQMLRPARPSINHVVKLQQSDVVLLEQLNPTKTR